MDKDHVYLDAAHELTELLHEFFVRRVQGHDDGDRYSCGAPGLADAIIGGGEIIGTRSLLKRECRCHPAAPATTTDC